MFSCKKASVSLTPFVSRSVSTTQRKGRRCCGAMFMNPYITDAGLFFANWAWSCSLLLFYLNCSYFSIWSCGRDVSVRDTALHCFDYLNLVLVVSLCNTLLFSNSWKVEIFCSHQVPIPSLSDILQAWFHLKQEYRSLINLRCLGVGTDWVSDDVCGMSPISDYRF